MSSRVSRLIFLSALSLFLLLGAGNALGQNADKNSAGPTKNDFRLRVVEPLEGATITGSNVRVTVANGMPGTAQGSSRTNDMPNPSFRVYLGGTLKGELKRDENVLTIENVPVGSQKLVVEAVNSSGEVIDRKEVNFQTVAATSSAALSEIPSTESRSGAWTEKPAAPSPVTSTTTSNPAASNPPTTTDAAPPPQAVTSSGAKALPQTGSSFPGVGVTGLALVLAGLVVSRERKR